MSSPTVHQVWKHDKSNELWAVRIDLDVLTGLFGPLTNAPAAEALADLPYEEHPDDLEWVIRAVDDFRVVSLPARSLRP